MASDAAAAREESQPRARAPPGANPPPSSLNRPSLSSSPASSSSSSSSSLSSKENRSALEHRRASAIYVGPSPLVQQHPPQGQQPSSSSSTASIPDQPPPPSARRHNGGLPSPPFTSSEGSGGGGSTRVVGDGPARASERREASRRGSVGGRSETSSCAGSGSAAGREERENRRIWELREKSGRVMNHLAQLSPATNRSQKQQSILGSGSPPPPSSPGGARASPSAFTFSRPPLRDDSGWSGSDTERERSQRHQKRASYSGSSTSGGSSSSLVGSRDGRREEFPVPRSLVARHVRNGSLPASGSDGGWSSPRGSDEGSNGSGRAALATSPRPPAAVSRSSFDAGVAASLSPSRHSPRSPNRRGPSARDPPSLRTSALLSRTAFTSSSHSRSSSLDGLPATLQRSQSTSSALSSNSSGSFGDIAPSSTEAGRRPSVVRIPSSTSSLVSSSSNVVRLRPSLSSTTTVKVKPREQPIALPSSTSTSSHASPAFRSSRLSTSSLALASATAAILDSPPLSPSKHHRRQGESSTTRYQRRHSRSDSLTSDFTSGGDDQLERQEEEERGARNGSGGRRRAPLPLDFRAEQQSSTYSEPPQPTKTLGRDASSMSLISTSTSMSHRRALTSLDRDRDRAASPDSFVSARASLDEHQRSPRTASRVQQPSSSSSSSDQPSKTTRRSWLSQKSLDIAAGGDGSPTWFPSSSITSTQQRASERGSEEDGSRASRRASTASSSVVSSSSHRRLYEDDQQDLFSASSRPSANGHGSSTAGSSTTTGAGGRGDQPPTTRRRLVSTREMLERIERENAESEKRRRELLENQAIRRAESVMSFAGAGTKSVRPESVAGSTVSLSSRAGGAAADFDRRFPPRTPVAMSARHHQPLQHFAASAQKAIRPSTSMAAYYDDAPRTAPPDGAGGGTLRSVRSIKNLQLEATASPSQLIRARRTQTDDSYQQQGSIRRPSTPNSSAAAAALARPRTAGGIEFPSSPSVASLAGGGSGQPTWTEHIRNLFEAFAQLEAYFRRLPPSSISGGADEDVVRGASKLVGHVEQTNASISDALAEVRDRLIEAQVEDDVPLGVSEELQWSYAILKEVKRTSDEEVRGLTSLMISLPRLAKEAAAGGEGGSNGGRATAMARGGDESPLAGRFDYPRSNRHSRDISDLAGNRYDLSNRPSTSQGHTMMSSPSQRFRENRESPRPRLPSIPSMRDLEPPTVGDLRTSPSTVSSRAVTSSTAASSRAAPSPSAATAATPARHKRPSVLHHVFDHAPTPTSPSSYDDPSVTTNTPVRSTRTSFTSTLRGTLSAAATSPGTPSLFAGEPTIALSTVTAAQTPASEYAPSLVGGESSESTTGSVGRWRTVSMFPTSTPSKATAVSVKDEEATISPVTSLPTTAAERRQSLPQGQGQQQPTSPTSPTSVLQRLSSFVSPKQGTVGLP